MNIKQKIKKLQKEVLNEVHMREQYWQSKPESWQDSLTGDKYYQKLDALRDFLDSGALDDVLLDL